MGDEAKLSRAEIERRIATGIGLVYDLYNELYGFLRMVIEGISASDLDVAIIRNGLMVLRDPSEKKTRTIADRYMNTDLGFIGELGADGGEKEINDEQDDEEQDTKDQQITKDSQFLAFHIALRGKNKSSETDATPKVIIGRLMEVQKDSRNKKSGSTNPVMNFKAKRKFLLRLSRQMDESIKSGDTISIRVPRHKISAKVQAVKKYNLTAFDSEKAVSKLIDDIVKMCT